MKLSQNPRILLYLAAISLSIIFIAVHGLNYGIDIQGGSSLQLQLEGAIVELNVDSAKILEQQFNTSSVQTLSDGYVVTVNGAVSTDLINKLGYSGSKVAARDNTTKITISASPESVVTDYLKNALDADVKVVGVAPVQYEIRTNVTRESLNAILAPVGGSVDTGREAFVEGLTTQTVDDTKKVLDQKLNRLGLKDIKVRVVGSQYILIDMAGVNVDQAQDVVGKPGKFEIKIQTHDNETEHVLYGDAVESVDIPSNNQGMWGVPFTLSEEGAKILQKAAIDSGATKNPQAHELSMYLDKDQIFSAPLAPELAASLNKVPSRSMIAEVGTGDAGSQKAKVLYIDLKEGALPVNVRIIGSGQVTAALGDQFKKQIVIAGLLALLAVGGMIYWRYRVRRIVLPLVATSTSEVIMILAVLSALGQQLDLAAIAGLITVIGTGVDQLVIITDRLMRGATALPSSKVEGKYAVSGGRLHEKRIMEILGIIIGSAATTVAAMLPLPFMGFGALTGFAVTVIIGVVVGVGIARPAYASVADYILGEDEKPETKAIGEESSSRATSRKEAVKEGNGKETAEEETNGRKAAKPRRKKGSRKNAEENTKEE